MPSSERLVPTPTGEARLLLDPASGPARRTVVLGHGAGAGAESPDLAALAAALPARGVDVIRVEQPWRVADKRVAPAPPVLDAAWLAALAAAHADGLVRGTLVAGGRSAGARVACRTARRTGASAVVALAFPLHPPGRPERSRWDELTHAAVPTLVVQGERDPFGRPEEFGPGPYELVSVPGSDHALRATEAVVAAVTAWLERLPDSG